MVFFLLIRTFDFVEDTAIRKYKRKNWSFLFVLYSFIRTFVAQKKKIVWLAYYI